MGSRRFSLNGFDWKKIGTGALIAVAGALATYLQDLIPTIDFGVWTPFVVALNSAVINFLRKFVTGY